MLLLRVTLQAVFREDLDQVSSQGGKDKGKPSIIAAYSESARSDISYAGPDFDSKTHHDRSPKDKKNVAANHAYLTSLHPDAALLKNPFSFSSLPALKLLLLPIIFFNQTNYD